MKQASATKHAEDAARLKKEQDANNIAAQAEKAKAQKREAEVEKQRQAEA